MSAKAPRKAGKGYEYSAIGHMSDWMERYRERGNACCTWQDIRNLEGNRAISTKR